MAVYFSHFLFEAPRASVLLPTAAGPVTLTAV